MGGQDKDWEVGIDLTQPARDLDAAEAGHHQVRNHNVGRLLGVPVEEFFGVIEDFGVEAAGRSEVGSQQLGVAEVVVEDVNFRYHRCNSCESKQQGQVQPNCREACADFLAPIQGP